MCDEVIDVIVKSYDEATKTISTKRTSTKTIPTKRTSTNFYILAFFLITIPLLTAVSIYCYQIKH